jgi:hypothetical protein
MQILGAQNMECRPKKLLDQVRFKPSQHVPTLLSRAEMQAVLVVFILT